MCRECARCACAAALLLLAAAALVAADDKRAEMSPMPFIMGSRYGRSSEPRLIAPRNDRFFMGSRYGKRSGLLAGSSSVVTGGGGVKRRALLCEFTGVVPLYRCVRHDKRAHYDARSADESGTREQE